MVRVLISVGCSGCDDDQLDCGDIDVKNITVSSVSSMVAFARREQGWELGEGDGTHLCPRCVKAMRELTKLWINKLDEIVTLIRNDCKISTQMKSVLLEGPLDQIHDLQKQLGIEEEEECEAIRIHECAVAEYKAAEEEDV